MFTIVTAHDIITSGVGFMYILQKLQNKLSVPMFIVFNISERLQILDLVTQRYDKIQMKITKRIQDNTLLQKINASVVTF